MRNYMLEKLVMVVNQARIIYNMLQPLRKAFGIKEACYVIAMALIQPFLDAKKQAQQTSKARKRKPSQKEDHENNDPTFLKKGKVSWKKASSIWTHEMAVNLHQHHFPVKSERDNKDRRKDCRQCSRERRVGPLRGCVALAVKSQECQCLSILSAGLIGIATTSNIT